MRTILFLLCAVARLASGQGGPPMLTDDPGTPGNGHWETNLATVFSHLPNEWSLAAPAIDLNYGWGDHFQLTLQTSAALLKGSDQGLIGGLGGTEAAVKWRYLDEATSGSICRCSRAFSLTSSTHRSGAGWRMPEHVSKYRFRWRSKSDDLVWARSSGR